MLTWTKQYEIGIPVIDEQHKRIVRYINQIEALKDQHDADEKLKDVLASLIDYTFSHFAFEEALMEEAAYPDQEEHEITHRAFEMQIKTLYDKFKRGEDIVEVLSDMLLSWLLQHIYSDDKSYAPYVRENILDRNIEKHHLWINNAIRQYFRH